jgi:predicted thioredoxin/glutaredoxin
MKIEVFESGCCQASNLHELVVRANGECGRAAEIARFTDSLEAIKRGIMRTPALVIDGRVVCAGRTPKYEEIAALLAGGKA